MQRGILITFEGGEGTGKTTQIKKVASWLKSIGHKVLVTREPGGTDLANWIRKILLRTTRGIDPFVELLLYEVARKDHVQKTIRPALQKGMIILCDRFSDATLAYQGYGRHLPISLIKSLNQEATGGIRPRLTFLLDLSPAIGRRRTQKRAKRPDRLDREKVDFHTAVRRGYLTLARNEGRFRIINTQKKPDEVFWAITREIQKVL